MSVHIDILDRTGGNGSRSHEEDWLDQNTTASEHQWSSAETTFYISDAPAGQQNKFKDLYAAHHGKGEGDRYAALHRMKMVADTDTFCAVLELPDPLRERVLYIMQDIDISSNNFGGKSYEKIALAVISLVYDEHLSAIAERGVSAVKYEQRLIFDEDFRELMDSNSVGSRELRSVREQVREEAGCF